MYKTGKYTSADRMSDLICDNYTLLQVMSRFGLPLGLGDKTVGEVCRENNVDCHTFLAVVNFMTEDNDRMEDNLEDISMPALINYLKQAHHYFLDFSLPTIRRKLIEAIDCSARDEVAFLILKFFDRYAGEVRRHMDYEDMNVFTYVENLMEGRETKGFRISLFARRHDRIDATLTELKNIIIKYYPGKSNNYLLNAALFDIFSCEQDLASHCRVEDYLFVPAVLKLEREVQ